jgi:hypothetical protein
MSRITMKLTNYILSPRSINLEKLAILQIRVCKAEHQMINWYSSRATQQTSKDDCTDTPKVLEKCPWKANKSEHYIIGDADCQHGRTDGASSVLRDFWNTHMGW